MNEVAEQVEQVEGPLTEPDADAVHRLAHSAAHTDHVDPLSEQPLLWLRDDSAQVTHLMVRAEDSFAGYAQLDFGAPGSASAELVVHPFARHHGVGTALLERVTELAVDRELSVWAHGDLPDARALAGRAGLVVVRELWSMRLDLAANPVAPPVLPDGVRARAFELGRDEEAWLAQNAAAFASHPEQGRLTGHDLAARFAEDWFDPAGFILLEDATDDGALLGSVWTKVDDGVGEIYAVGVAPAAQGRGFGRVLTALGLDHLATLGLAEVVLYVEADNAAAVHTYRAAGFTQRSVSVKYGLPDA